jgi:hypothetical protein
VGEVHRARDRTKSERTEKRRKRARTGALAEFQVRRLLGLESRFQVHALLKEHNVALRYTAADLEDDLQTQRELGILPNQ